MLSTTWHRFLGIRPEEGKTVWLFFLHNFLLGIGTILVYVSANVILLENNPERNLPLAYGVAALALMAVGRVYTHFEHQLQLQRLAVRVLLAVVVLTGVLGVLVAVGHSVAAAVAIMAGYRIIYLLTNLEFWGVSAVVFDVRQSKRLFSLISSGDMPAKALGAVLAVLVHGHTDLLFLLLLAFGAYGGALLTLRTTLASHVVEAKSVARRQRQQAPAAALQRWFGNSELVLSMCLSLLAVAAITTGVEYSFFVNVKHKFHDQATLMRYLGTFLALTYLLAMVFKVLLSQFTLERMGIRRMLLALPVLVLLGVLAFGGLRYTAASSSVMLLYFCGLFLGLEVLRRAVFDPVFLVLFQALSAEERLQAHTTAKGLYEPLGMGLAGLLLFALHHLPGLSEWLPFVWMGLFAAGALLFLRRTYGHYLAELQHAVSRRFTDDTEIFSSGVAWHKPTVAATNEAPEVVTPEHINQLIAALTDRTQRRHAMTRLVQLGETAVPLLADALRVATQEVQVQRLAQVCGHIRTPASRQALVHLVQQPRLFGREAALRALRTFDQDPTDAPAFQVLVREELQLAQQLLHGLSTAPNDLRRALDYELTRVQQRIFGLLLQLYSPQFIADAQRGVAHAARERQANALEILDNIIPRSLYQGLQALLDVLPVSDKIRTFNQLLGAPAVPVAVVPLVVWEGEACFSDWTVSVALPYWHPEPGTVAQLLPHLESHSLLVRESAFAVLDQLAKHQPDLHQQLVSEYPLVVFQRMDHHAAAGNISAQERVQVLHRTALFAETPENVLSSIVPIMKEVTFHEGQEIFAKGDLGTSLFIVYEGEVNIFNGTQQLATFKKGDFFGELALLDAEPRSATAVAHGSVVAFRLDQEDFYDVMEERGEVLRNVLRVLCQRLRRQNEKMQVPG
ncbi:cyclic nucleotide-binding domain-containing protein [Hymenobacter sp. YC55]|uniref:cyclic nucleotide-binding domain-containing protein n=1 Tax=Hymenobacter sp. YC55 TaxID=3034019 RepID=UPI0023F6619C|nr:cyclic nucleotide-binding domain-containing protein [Hymenobacter sp. YC55]MDF7810006.1 cyclic nucleotide-binding domain-containing protein [Hymenobacter sp. YC55]